MGPVAPKNSDGRGKIHKMIIGIVSDSHGQLAPLRAAIELFGQRRVEAVVHCGDIGSIQCLDVLGHRDIPVFAAAGNVDCDVPGMLDAAANAGVRLGWEMIEVPLPDGGSLAATHGHNALLLRSLIDTGRFAYVCHGHTHKRRDELIDNTRVINPGALHRTPQPTVAILVTGRDTLEFLDLPRKL